MPIPVILPTLGPAIEEATLIKWLVPPGGLVRQGQPLFSVETDKTITDVDSPAEGYLVAIVAEEGSTVRVDQVLATLSENAPAEVPKAPEAPEVPKVPEASEAPEALVSLAETPAAAPAHPDTTLGISRFHASPRARRLARESGVPIEQVSGTGPGGRVLERDIAEFVSGAVARWQAPPQPGVSAAHTPRRSGASRDVALSPMRRSIARRMSESAQAAPVFFTTVKVLADNLASLRAQLLKTHSRKVSTNDLVVKACAIALSRHRALNASFGTESLAIHDDIDISVAVALDDGLITPIVRNADLKPLMVIADEIRDLADRARSNQLSLNDYQGGTFTVSNLGMFGVEAFTAIINPPQSAILAVGGIDHEVWLDAGVARERAVMRLTLTSDHRVIDGAQAARFLGTLRELLENPAGLLV